MSSRAPRPMSTRLSSVPIAACADSGGLSVSAPMPGTGGTLELPRHPSAAARKGTRPVFFPDAGKMLPTQVFDRYALEPGVTIEGPAVFEEDESTFIVGPGAKARLLADGSILAEVG